MFCFYSTLLCFRIENLIFLYTRIVFIINENNSGAPSTVGYRSTYVVLKRVFMCAIVTDHQIGLICIISEYIIRLYICR